MVSLLHREAISQSPYFCFGLSTASYFETDDRIPSYCDYSILQAYLSSMGLRFNENLFYSRVCFITG